MPLAATSVALRAVACLTGVGAAIALLLAAPLHHVLACSYVTVPKEVGFRGSMTGLTQGPGGTYDVTFVVSEVFQGVVQRHVEVQDVPADHLDYVRRSSVDVHALEFRGEFDWEGPCDSPDISTTPFVGVGYAPAPDPASAPGQPPIPAEAHGMLVPLAVIGGLVLFLGVGCLAVRRSD